MKLGALFGFCVVVLAGNGCPRGDVTIDAPGNNDEGEGEGEGAGEGEGEVALIAATNDTCLSAIALDDGVAFSMPGFTATASRDNCSSTNDAGDDGIEDVAFSFALEVESDVTITADGDVGGEESWASPTLTLFDTPLCAFPREHTVDERTCVGDGLTFDAPTILTTVDLPAGTWFVVAETFGDLSPFSIRVDIAP